MHNSRHRWLSFTHQIKLIDLIKYLKAVPLMLISYMCCANCLGATSVSCLWGDLWHPFSAICFYYRQLLLCNLLCWKHINEMKRVGNHESVTVTLNHHIVKHYKTSWYCDSWKPYTRRGKQRPASYTNCFLVKNCVHRNRMTSYKTILITSAQFDNCNSVWAPYKKGDIDIEDLEKVRKRATRIIPALRI